ncbi:MAG: hypothetical protein DRI61_07995 [Chloroflexi bacterium]|nr:MAG: hypothetical protein DRI61_07995 [Chloroflexota bacterium]
MGVFDILIGGFSDKVNSVESKKRESYRKGGKRTILLPSIAPGDFLQYDYQHPKLSGLVKTYGLFNTITVINNTSADLMIELDYSRDKSYLVVSHSTLTVEEVEYLGFNVKNVNSDIATEVNQCTIIVAYEPSLIRERRIERRR